MLIVFSDRVEKSRFNPLHMPPSTRGDRYGFFLIKLSTGCHASCMVSDGEEWPFESVPFEHVSVTIRKDGISVDRCPTWEEMCEVRDCFWGPEELVIQYHPPKSQYVNRHRYCLHLWKPIGVTIPLPPRKSVG